MSRAFVSLLAVVLLTSGAPAQQTDSAVGQPQGEAGKASDATGSPRSQCGPAFAPDLEVPGVLVD